MRFLTMNIFAHHRDWDARRPCSSRAFELDPDVVTLQEAIT